MRETIRCCGVVSHVGRTGCISLMAEGEFLVKSSSVISWELHIQLIWNVSICFQVLIFIIGQANVYNIKK